MLSRPDAIRAMIFLGLVACVYTLEAGLWIRYFILRKSHSPHPRRALTGKGAFCIHAAALLGILCLAYAYWIEPTWIEVKHIKLCCNKFNAGSLRLIQISDTHCDLKERNESRVVEIINGLKPDVIVFTGDALNDIGALPTFQKMLGSLKASIGKFAIRGNIDNHYYRSMDLFAGTGFQELRGTIHTFEKQDNSITISGLIHDRKASMSQLAGKLDHKTLNIFLYHTPDLIDDSTRTPVDLYLAGHLHGGQVALPFYGALITMSAQGKKYESGIYPLANTTHNSSIPPTFGRTDSIAYVNRGIGMEGGISPRVRFCARPEITVFDIFPPPPHPVVSSNHAGGTVQP
jgi:predicted MPP superfamily phosphohydrolase